MKTYEKDLTEVPLFKGIFFYSAPLILTNLLQVLFNIADVAVVGRFAGALPLGSVGSTSQLLFFFTGLLMGLSGGINVIVAYYIGAKSKKDISESVHTAFIISLIAGFILMIVGFFFARPILTLIKTKPELLDGAVTYFSIYMLSMPGVAIYNYGNAVLGAAGDTKRPLYFLTISGVVNIILNLFFVIVCDMDCAGVALSTVISQYISAILVMIPLFIGIGDVKFSLKSFRLNGEKSRRILKIGVPVAFQDGLIQVAFFL